MVFVHRVKRRKMTDFIHLTGAEDVYRAGTIIMGAAETMKQAAALIDDTLGRHQRFMDDWLQRFEAAMEEIKK